MDVTEGLRVRDMSLPRLANFASKLVLQILPSVSATVIGGYLLAQIHMGATSGPAAPPVQPPPRVAAVSPVHDDRPTVREDRATMREMLKARRENTEAPATVKQKVAVAATPASAAPASPAPTSPAANTPMGTAMDSDSLPSKDLAEHAARTPVAATPRSRPDARVAETHAPEARAAETHTESAEYVPAPPPGMPPAPAMSPLTAPQPTPLTPAVVAAPVVTPAAPVVASVAPPMMAPPVIAPSAGPMLSPPMAGPMPGPSALPPPAALPYPPAQPDFAAQEPPQRGPVASVFSTLSGFVGHAANATGHTVNWVIDLPGKAIQAGGHAIGVDSPPPPPPPRPFS